MIFVLVINDIVTNTIKTEKSVYYKIDKVLKKFKQSTPHGLDRSAMLFWEKRALCRGRLLSEAGQVREASWSADRARLGARRADSEHGHHHRDVRAGQRARAGRLQHARASEPPDAARTAETCLW